jgi:putative Mg2+ transporter-C (MgtC) family protein
MPELIADALRSGLPLLAAIAMGGAIGIERNFHGHAAGFRTHALVCLTSCALMLVIVEPSRWMGVASADTLRLNITRVIQGIMTGIGFLGAGIILKQGLEVRGLTTAAAIWCNAAIGVLVGLGSLLTAAIATGLTLLVLTAFRRVESRFPAQLIMHLDVSYARAQAPEAADVRALAAGMACSIDELTFALEVDDVLTYRMILKTRAADAMERLARRLAADPLVRHFDLALRRD